VTRAGPSHTGGAGGSDRVLKSVRLPSGNLRAARDCRRSRDRDRSGAARPREPGLSFQSKASVPTPGRLERVRLLSIGHAASCGDGHSEDAPPCPQAWSAASCSSVSLDELLFFYMDGVDGPRAERLGPTDPAAQQGAPHHLDHPAPVRRVEPAAAAASMRLSVAESCRKSPPLPPRGPGVQVAGPAGRAHPCPTGAARRRQPHSVKM
jgi:hypothetical protein